MPINNTHPMASWVFILFALFSSERPQSMDPVNQTNLQEAKAEMRTWSYHGFVILFRILNGKPNFLQDREITFLMPEDEELSKVVPKQKRLQDFVLRHSIPTALMLSHLLHLPNGTLAPSSLPNRMLNIRSRKSDLFVKQCKDCHSKRMSELSHQVPWN